MIIPLLLFISSVSDLDLKSAFEKMKIVQEEAKEAPDFRLPDLSGDTLSLSDFSGKIVLLNFWASWCPPCRYEMPTMEQLWKDFKEKGLVILAVDLGEPREKVLEFAKKLNLTFPILLDRTRDIGRKYRVFSIPTTFIISPEGKIIAKAIGYRNWKSPESLDLFNLLLSKYITNSE